MEIELFLQFVWCKIHVKTNISNQHSRIDYIWGGCSMLYPVWNLIPNNNLLEGQCKNKEKHLEFTSNI